MTTFSIMPKTICTTPIAKAIEKKLPWKSKNGTEGKYSLRFMPNTEPQASPTTTVVKPHNVANHAA